MDKAAKLKQALIEVLGINPNLAITAEVVSVENTTCTVKLVSELVLSDVRLCATINQSEDLFVMAPKIGSEVVLMSQTGKLSGLMVMKMDAVESVAYKKGAFEFLIDGTTGKVTLKKGSVNFGKLIGNLIDTISNALIDTPSGPGAINATTKTQLNQLKTQFNSVLNSD
ncbi:hypothetical protein [Flavobacterium gilvum]|uniref:Uncharacterized protein n=1 Tax=Flavobacterium gilvum TaxID=1492737 RepID=A0AAC9I2G8_9FLAO|nr:hypothetical protein [Flavobacterium gilvum]AOW08750.1 hypothetical protein EM308_04115 [Flavobacterium gilvum]KFC59809.1 hypothetical protein FEM08_13200 [Flavobacterium gilvum]